MYLTEQVSTCHEVAPARTVRKLAVSCCSLVALLICGAESIRAADLDSGQTEASILEWPGLLESPGESPKQFLRDHGIDVDASVTHAYQGFLEADANKEWVYGGKASIKAIFDLEQFGLGDGLSLQLIQEWNFGSDLNSDTDGTLLPIIGVVAFPRLGGYDQDTSVILTQKFNENLSVSAGKFNLLDLVSRTPIVGGGGIETFMNAALAGPITGIIPPYILGAQANIATDWGSISMMVYDPRNAQDPDVISDPFADGTAAFVSLTVPMQVAGRSGHYGMRGVYSSQEGLDLDQIPSFIELPPEAENTLTKKGRWYVNVSAQQYLYEDPDHPGAGWGVFGYASISDGNPNAYEWTTYVGLGGTNPMAGRHLDKWGIAYFRYGLSSDLKRGLADIGSKIRDEQGLRCFITGRQHRGLG